MPLAALTKGEWEEVKMASIAGVPDEKVAKEWGITPGALRKRRERECWMTPRRAEIERQKARETLRKQGKQSVRIVHGTENVTESVPSKPTAAEVIMKSKEEYGETNRMALLSKLSPVLQNAVTDRPNDFSPNDIKELVSLGSFLHKMADLDKPESSVTVSVWGSSTSLSQDLRDVEGQARTVSDEEKKLLGEWG